MLFNMLTLNCWFIISADYVYLVAVSNYVAESTTQSTGIKNEDHLNRVLQSHHTLMQHDDKDSSNR